MTDVLFITPMDKLAIYNEVNGTLLLATKLLQAGISTEVLRFCQIDSYKRDYSAFIRDITDRILQIAPKCVSFYTIWPSYHIVLRIAQEVKNRKADMVVVMGGPMASITAEATMRAMGCVDYICTGEGENTVVPFFSAVLRGDQAALSAVPGLLHRDGGEIVSNGGEVPLSDLDALPNWDDRLYLDLYAKPGENIDIGNSYMGIDVGRGCPFNCTFCCSSHFWKRTYRLKTPEKIVENIRYFYERFGIKRFAFSHDAFTVNRRLVTEVCERILESGMQIQWKCTTRINCITEELVLKMKQAGLVSIELGIETGSARMQQVINKKLDLSKVEGMVRFLRKQDINVALYFMYGFPEETEEDLNQTLQMAYSLADIGIGYMTMALCNFNPGTAITERYFDQLVYDENHKMVSRGIFGYEEEEQRISENKGVFPFYYHMHTPVRDNYPYLTFLLRLYRGFPITAPYIRGLYQGDNLKFYRDFHVNNEELFTKDLLQVTKYFLKQPLEVMYNTIKNFDLPYMRQLRALIKFDYDMRCVGTSKEDTSVQDVYDFNYMDYMRKLPIEQYSDHQSKLLIEKKNGVVSMRVLDIQ